MMIKAKTLFKVASLLSEIYDEIQELENDEKETEAPIFERKKDPYEALNIGRNRWEE